MAITIDEQSKEKAYRLYDSGGFAGFPVRMACDYRFR